jgi:SpoVK/Ycf46/Vps4 family AAA+-type ATPase
MKVRKRRRTEKTEPPVPYKPGRIESLANLIERVDNGSIPVPAGVHAATLSAALTELDAFVGAGSIKRLVTNMVVLVCLGLNDTDDFTNVAITGNPGTGKTCMLGIIAEVWCALFHGKKGRVTWLCRPQLIGEHLGETACKTARALADAAPGVVVIDEVYSLGAGTTSSKGDSFAKECIDTLNQFISECRTEITVIVAGYTDATNECFFAQNPGLLRRFPWQFKIEDYTPDELIRIARLQLERGGWTAFDGWTLLPDVAAILKHAPNNGGDTQLLLHECKLAHAMRVPSKSELRFLTADDFALACKQILRARAADAPTTSCMYMYT